jgi:hypothetical protein
MKILLSLCCVMLAMVLHPGALNKESAVPFRTINIYQREFGYSNFESMAITTGEDLNAFLEEMSQLGWNNRQAFVDALRNAKIDFNHEALVLLRHTEGSGSVGVSFETPVLQGKTLICEIRGEPPLGAGTADMAYHCFAIAVSKSLVDKVQLNSIPSVFSPERPRPAIVLSTTERQPLKINRPTPPQMPEPGDCPKLTLDCPTDLLETGKTYTVTAVVEGGKPKYEVFYGWSVQGGEITEGQGIRTLKFRIKEPNQIVKVFVELGGFNPYCDRIASCEAGPTR